MKKLSRILIHLTLAMVCLLPVSAQAISVTETSPTSGATDVLSDAVITASFNEQPNPATLTTDTFKVIRNASVTAVSAGAQHSLALRSDGSVVAWGSNSFGQASVLADLTGVAAISAGPAHSLALKSDGTVVQWGTFAAVPPGLSGVVAIAAGVRSLALKSDGTVVEWGGPSTIPASLSGVVAIATGGVGASGYHNLALKNDGTVVAWGDNLSGESTVPPGLSDVIAIAAGANHSLALKGDGSVVVWGSSQFGLQVIPGSVFNVTAIAAAGNICLVMKGDGTLVAWGGTTYNQTLIPFEVNSSAIAIASGQKHNLALKNDGSVIAWGNNDAGQITVPITLSDVALGGDVTYVTNNTDNFTAIFTPSAALPAATTFNAIVSGGITDFYGNLMISDYLWNFTTTSEPLIKVFPASAWFGPLATGLTSAPYAFTVTNSGNTMLDVNTTLTGPNSMDFTVSPGFSSIEPGKTGRISVRFTPKSAGAKSAFLHVESNDQLTPTLNIPLSGTSLPLHLILHNYPPNGTINCISPVAEGATATCTISPDGGYRLSALTDNGISQDVLGLVSGGVYSIANVTVQHAVDAIFEPPPVTGVCGSAAGKTTRIVPGTNFCSIGSMVKLADAGVGTNIDRWSWDCNGLYTGSTPAHCHASYLPPPVASPGSPTNGAVDVALDISAITATFDQDMDPATITGNSFTVSKKVGITQIAGGGSFGLALNSEGRVVVWGYHMSGLTVIPAEALSGVTAVAAGFDHILALKNGKVLAWGSNVSNQTTVPEGALTGVTAISAGETFSLALKNGTVLVWGNQAPSPPQDASAGVTAIAAGAKHGLALKDGRVLAWGLNANGQTNVPEEALSGVTAIAAGGNFSLALKNGKVLAWGSNDSGETAIPEEALTEVTAIAAGWTHGLALKGGSVLTWGENGNVSMLAPLEAGSGVTAISAGMYFSLALKGVNVMAWGYNPYGQTTVPSEHLTGASAISAGWGHGLAMKSGKVVAWGYNANNQTNVPVEALSDVSAIAAGYDHSLALKNGKVLAWGNNQSGQATVPAEATSGVTAIAAGIYHSMALKGGKVIAWGQNIKHQTNVPSEALSGVSAIAAGSYHSMALKDGKVLVWGDSTSGITAVPAEALSGVTAIAAGDDHCLALKGGKVLAWGTTSFDRAQVPAEALSGVTAIAAGGYHNLALKGGTVLAWGYKAYGQIAIPAEALSGVTAITGGYLHSLALKVDGKVLAWGSNDYGQATIPYNMYETPISGGVTYDQISKTATFSPSAPLPYSSTIVAKVNTGAKSLDGYVQLADMSWSFATRVFYQVTTNTPTNGTINCPALVLPGETATCTITPDAGYRLLAFTDNGADISTPLVGGSYSITGITANHTLVATFEHQPINGICGSAAGKTSSFVPVTNVCKVGVPANFTDAGADKTTNRWSWNCSGQFAGSVTAHCASNYHIAPTTTSGSPANGAATVSPNLSAITATFNQDMDPNTITTNSFSVTKKVSITAIAAGANHSLALNSDGGVTAWGDNTFGQATVPDVLKSGVSSISAGEYHSLALQGGSVVAWGSSTYGQNTVPTEARSGVTAISAGGEHCLALKNGGVLAWGYNEYGQSTVPPEAASDVIAIAAGLYHSLALKSDGSVVAWGYDGIYRQTTVPPGLTDVIAIAAGYGHSLALKRNGSVVAWGNADGAGQAPVPNLALNGVSAISAGNAYSMAVINGSVVVWGYNESGATPVAGLSGVTAISAGWFHRLYLKNDGSVVAWGDNLYGQATVPTSVLAGVIAVAAGASHSLVLNGNGSVVSWGYNDYGQVSVPAAASSGVIAIAGGRSHALALKDNGSVLAWGQSENGATNVPAAASSGVTAIAGGVFHSLALKNDGGVLAWGSNNVGQVTLPDLAKTGVIAIAAGSTHNLALLYDGSVIAWGDTTDGKTSVPDSAKTGVSSIAAGDSHSLALKNGEVLAWGGNTFGQSTVPEVAKSGVIAIAAGQTHSLALKNDGSVIAWGSNNGGVLSVPSSALSGVVGISVYMSNNMALKRDGSVVVWGYQYTPMPINIYAPPISGSVIYDNGTRTATFTPSAALPLGTTFVATVTSGVKTVDGVSPLTDTSWSFSTQGAVPMQVTPLSIDFGTVVVNTPAMPTITFSISNSGAVPLIISSIEKLGPAADQFVIAGGSGNNGTCGSLTPTIAPGVPCTIMVTFAPTSVGSKNISLRISSTTPQPAFTDITLDGIARLLDISFNVTPQGTGVDGVAIQQVPYGGASSPVTALPATGYSLFRWMAAPNGFFSTANPLTVSNITNDMQLTATFAANAPSATFATLQAAYTAAVASSGAIHLASAGTTPTGSGTPVECVADTAVEVYISGGYTGLPNSLARSGKSVVTGAMKIRAGKVIMDGVAIQ